MRLLIINSNTSERVTAVVAEAARRFASPDTDLVFATSDFGPEVIASRTENAIAQHATVDLVARHATGCDGVLIAVSYDSGLRAARELLDIPVLALTESALLAAMTLGTRIGVVAWGRGAIALYAEVIDAYGLAGRICGSKRIDVEMPADRAGQHVLDEAILTAARDLVAQQEAEVIVLVGAVLSGCSLALQDRVAVPLLDGVRCAVPMLEAMVRIGARPPLGGSYAMPGGRASRGLSPELGRRLARGA